ncbi:DUF5906 domain-containing protein [Psychrosphaera haliotis]|uniref:Integrase n=1 Tax=Psychrosphaera haliotis TaxID=555083 RepID=A0A6N8FG47_9GAMM|nr:DUF5906 domain-containing protein [Psychrosphaera haliotis]MUH73632.1 integrase [Psychrosphaera haliotis]
MEQHFYDTPPLDAYEDAIFSETEIENPSYVEINRDDLCHSDNGTDRNEVDKNGNNELVNGAIGNITKTDENLQFINECIRTGAGVKDVNGTRRIDANKNGSINQNEAEYSIKGKPLKKDDLQRLEKLNEKYTHVNVAGKHKVVSYVPCPVDGNSLNLESLHEFKNNFLDEDLINGLNVGDAWLSWKGKNYKPDGINFYPNPKLCPKTVFNTFRGFKSEPNAGDVSPFLDHIEKVLCNGDIKAAKYVIGFLAHLLQRPEEKPSVAILLKSVEGTGKGTFFEPIKRILGTLAVQVNGGYQLTGRFNGIVDSKLLVFADEVDLRDPRTADKMKGLISEPRATLERKGIDPIQVQNSARFIFASNHDFVLKAGSKERRYLVLEPDSSIAQDKGYFDVLWQWINNDGSAHLMHYLLNYDLKDFDPRRAPLTQALVEEKLSSLSPVQQWMYEELNLSNPFEGAVRVDCSEFTKACFDWCEKNGYPMALPSIRSSLGKLLKNMKVKRLGRSDRGGYYELDTPKELKLKFANLLGCKLEEVFD